MIEAESEYISRTQVFGSKNASTIIPFFRVGVMATEMVSSQAPVVLDIKKEYFGGDHTYTFARASTKHEWDVMLEICCASVMGTLSMNAESFLRFITVEDLVPLSMVNGPFGDSLMWMCFATGRPDFAAQLPVLPSLKHSRLLDRESQRQELFEALRGKLVNGLKFKWGLNLQIVEIVYRFPIHWQWSSNRLWSS